MAPAGAAEYGVVLSSAAEAENCRALKAEVGRVARAICQRRFRVPLDLRAERARKESPSIGWMLQKDPAAERAPREFAVEKAYRNSTYCAVVVS